MVGPARYFRLFLGRDTDQVDADGGAPVSDAWYLEPADYAGRVLWSHPYPSAEDAGCAVDATVQSAEDGAMSLERRAGTAHTCHAVGCEVRCAPEMLMCLKHWRMVPAPIRRAVWRSYRPGQCEDKRPSAAWLGAAKAAIRAVARKEGRRV